MSRSDDDRLRRIRSRSLAHAKLKAERAHEHLKAVISEIKAFYESHLPNLTEEEHPERGEHWLYVKFPEPPERVFILTGDFVHCLRCALDYIAYDLCLIGDGKINPKSQFPIFSERTAENLKTFSRYTAGMPKDAVDIVERLQPYHRGDAYRDDPLWQLHKLDIIDKHRRIPLSGISYTIAFFRPTKLIRRGALNDGFGAVLVLPIVEKVHFQLDPRLTIYPIPRFGGKADDIDVTVDGLADIYKFVTEDAIPRFAGFFTKDIAS